MTTWTCPFCGCGMPEPFLQEFPCPVCGQAVGKDDRGKLVRAAEDSREPWEKPYLRCEDE